MTPHEFVERHPNPFVVYAGGALRRVDPGKTRGLTVDRLVIEGSAATRHQAISDNFLVGELAPTDPAEAVVTIGVSSSCDLTVNDSSLSKRHAWFDRVGTDWRVWDNDSVSGTQVNGEPVRPGAPRVLIAGDRITLGYVDLTYLTTAAFHQLVKALFA
jgi:hypothetical protein